MYVRLVVVGQVVAEGLAAMPPGPGLAAALAELDLECVPNDDVIDVLRAQSRQLAHEQARMFAALSEVICRRPFAGPGQVWRAERPDLYGADEVRAALSWTRRAAESETDLAHTLVATLPRVQAALAAGLIDRGKAWVFARHLPELSAAQIAAVCAAVLPHAPRWTTGQIADRIKRMLLELDPAYYERRYRKAVRDRMVVAYLAADGTAVLSASGLPADEAAAAWERLDALAREVRRNGHPGTLDQVRADLVLGLLDGSLHGLTRVEIHDALLARFAGHADTDRTVAPGAPGGSAGNGAGPDSADPDGGDPDGGDPDGGDPDGGDPDGGDPDGGDPDGGDPDGGDPDGGDDPPGDGGPGSEGGPDGGGPDRGGPRGRGPGGGAGPGEDGARPGPGDGAVGEGSEPRVGTGVAASAASGEDLRVGIEIRVPLSTLLGLDERPGEMPGWGPVPAGVARRAVARGRRAQWRWVVVDDAGHLLGEGLTRRRPPTLARGGPGGGIMEIAVPVSLLETLAGGDHGDHGPWAGVVADIADRYAAGREHGPGVVDLDAHPGDRFPRAGLRRNVQVRDRTCVHPGCRSAARRCDQDHTLDHARGGPTTRGDLAALCRHDHMLKTVGGWELLQPEPGRLIWRSPLGREYPVSPEPILPPPAAPLPRDPDPWFDRPAPDTDHQPDLRPRDRAPPRPDPAPVQPDTTGTRRDQPPPF